MYTEFLIHIDTEETGGLHTKISIFTRGVGGEMRKTGMTCEINFCSFNGNIASFRGAFLGAFRKIAKSDYCFRNVRPFAWNMLA